MQNPCLDAALHELESAGIRDVAQARGGKHLQLRWKVNGHGLRMYPVPLTPSDWRSPLNVRAEIRRLLREDGVLPERSERPAPPPKPAPKPDRLTELEQRITALEAIVRTMQTQGWEDSHESAA